MNKQSVRAYFLAISLLLQIYSLAAQTPEEANPSHTAFPKCVELLNSADKGLLAPYLVGSVRFVRLKWYFATNALRPLQVKAPNAVRSILLFKRTGI